MNHSWKIFLPLIFALILSFDAGTAEAVGGGYLSGYEEVEPKPTAVSWWSTLAYLLSLLAVFAVVVVMAYFTAKFIGGRFNARMSTGGGRVLENLPLAPNRSVCIVEMAGRVFLLGVGENITFLDEITDEETIRSLREKNRAANDIFYNDFGSVSELIQKIPPIFRKK
ncbi:MAG: flagellar biosynthetic protein FliO [Selenomonadaceae bacterium]|nr:flagellar biosynthetic protein FliO [Selenomonadaceae bacterium]